MIKLGIQIKFESILMTWQKSKEIAMVTSARSEPGSKNNIDNINELFGSEPDCSTSTSTNSHHTISMDIEKIMKTTSQGRSILSLYENDSKLNEGSRSVVVDLVINYMIQNDIRMTVILAKKTAEAILKVFKTEFMVRIHFFVK